MNPNEDNAFEKRGASETSVATAQGVTSKVGRPRKRLAELVDKHKASVSRVIRRNFRAGKTRRKGVTTVSSEGENADNTAVESASELRRAHLKQKKLNRQMGVEKAVAKRRRSRMPGNDAVIETPKPRRRGRPPRPDKAEREAAAAAAVAFRKAERLAKKAAAEKEKLAKKVAREAARCAKNAAAEESKLVKKAKREKAKCAKKPRRAINKLSVVSFTFEAEPGKRVFIAGSFNDWNAEANELRDVWGKGVYSCVLNLERGDYQYKLVVDGVWCNDPKNPAVIENGLGSYNNVIVVK